MTVQLAARVACSTLADVNINDFRVADVCVSVQSLSGEPAVLWCSPHFEWIMLFEVMQRRMAHVSFELQLRGGRHGPL